MIHQSELKTLIADVDGWAIVRYSEGNEACADIVYGEHLDGCRHPFDGETANWCWDWSDGLPGKIDSCWMCKSPVPESVVGIVRMMNWEKEHE